MDKKIAEGPHLFIQISRTHERVAMVHKESGNHFLPMWGESECSSSNKMPIGRRWGGKESCASRWRQKIVSGSSGINQLETDQSTTSASNSFHSVGCLFRCLFVWCLLFAGFLQKRALPFAGLVYVIGVRAATASVIGKSTRLIPG